MNHGPLIDLIYKTAKKEKRTFGEQLMHLAQLGLEYEREHNRTDHIRQGRRI